MDRTIRVSGEGTISAPADCVELSLYLETTEKEYSKAYETAGQHGEELQNAVVSLGFDKKDLKTQSYNISARYDSVRDKEGNYKEVFIGYCVSHSMILRFDFNENMLSAVLTTLSETKAAPRMNIRFTVKDQEIYKMELLEEITADAKKKAKKLAEASDVELSDLIKIDYSFGNVNFYSETAYDCVAETRMLTGMNVKKAYGFTAEDVRITERATFEWLIK